jgi:hypothetical protein
MRRIVVLGQPGKKSSQTHSMENKWVWWCTPVIPMTAGNITQEARLASYNGKYNIGG